MRSAEPATGGLLFIPVSGGSGSGELQRVRLLARSAHQRWPDLPIAIAAEQRALSVAADSGIHTLPLPRSPTRCSAKVIAAIEAFRPALVIFDSTARPAQLRAARRIGARVVYISSRPSARARGFRWGAFGSIDEHWSVEFDPDGELPGRWQRFLLRRRSAPRWRPLSTLSEVVDASALPAVARDFLAGGPFVLFCPGGGGGEVEGKSAATAYGAAAEHSGLRAIAVLADQPSGPIEVRGALLRLPAQPNAALMALLQSSELAVVGAGSLLLQALALGTPCLALPLARDQPARLAQLVQRGAVSTCPVSIAALALAARELCGDPARLAALRARAQSLALRNGLTEALDAILALLDRPLDEVPVAR
jgi:hypothetical protein